MAATLTPPGPPLFASEQEEGLYYLERMRGGPRAERLEARVRLAELFARREQLDEAARLYERALQLGARDPALPVALAEVYRRQGQDERAEATLARTRRRRLRGGRVWLAAGALLLLAGLAVVGPLALSLSRPAEETAAPPAEEEQVVACALPESLEALRLAVGPEAVGACQAEVPAEGGSTLYRLDGGELLWRPDDAYGTFSDGEAVWVVGAGRPVERRLPDQRFWWEPDAADPAVRPLGPTRLGPAPVPQPTYVLPERRLVVYYGNPLSELMGVLGEGTPEQMLERLGRQARAYQEADPARPVLPALALVTPTAQAQPGEDGLYRARMPRELMEQVANWAERRGYLLFLDVQIGHSTVADEVEYLVPYLRRPYVHLALDPEFAMPPGEKPGETIGTLDAEQINVAIRRLGELVTAHGLPPKVLVVHRFLDGMVTRHERIRLDPRVQVVIDMDGFGSPPVKIAKYDRHVRDQRVQYAGVKLFYQYDAPLMQPSEVVELDPPPDVVIYQ